MVGDMLIFSVVGIQCDDYHATILGVPGLSTGSFNLILVTIGNFWFHFSRVLGSVVDFTNVTTQRSSGI